MKSRLLLLSLICTTASACDSESPFDVADVIGLYVMSLVSGESPPFVRRETSADPYCLRGGVTGDLVERIDSGLLELRSNGRFTLSFSVLRICTYGTTPVVSHTDTRTQGDFSIDQRTLLLEPEGSGWARITGSANDSRFSITMQIPGDFTARTYVFARFR